MKTDLAHLSDENTALKAQVSTLQDTIAKQQDELDEIKAGRAKERQALIDEVSALLAEKTTAHHVHPASTAGEDDPAAPPKKHVSDDADSTPPEPAARHDAPSLAPPPEASGPTAADADDSPTTPAKATAAVTPPPPPAPAVHSRKGYYHVVAAHETLSLICAAYRDHGVQVTVAQIRHANGLTAHSELKVGQKLFIPKPST
jgi:LysM repeat protein